MEVGDQCWQPCDSIAYGHGHECLCRYAPAVRVYACVTPLVVHVVDSIPRTLPELSQVHAAALRVTY